MLASEMCISFGVIKDWIKLKALHLESSAVMYFGNVI